MAVNVWTIGGATAVGTAINAAGAGTFGGADGTFTWLRPVAGAASISIGADLLTDPEVGRIPRQAPRSGDTCSGSNTFFLSFAYLENLFRLIFQGAITTTGAAVPYSHALAFVENGEIYGGHKYFWKDFEGGLYEICAKDVIVTKLTLDLPTNAGTPTLVETWEGKSWVKTASPSAPTISSYDLARWTDISLFLDGTNYKVRKITLDFDSPIGADDFGHVSANDGTRVSLIRNGLMTVGLNLEKNMDSVDLGWITSPADGLGDFTDNYLLINNGGTSTALREIKICLGKAFLKRPELQLAEQGPLAFTASFEIRDPSGAGFLSATFKNALTAIA